MGTMKNKAIEPNLVIIKINETSNWGADIQEKAKKIYGYYLVDLSTVTHLCEIADSLYCEFLYNRFECIESFLDSEGEATDELTELENFEGESMYIYENSHLDIVHKHIFDENNQDDYEGFIEGIVDYYKGNPVE